MCLFAILLCHCLGYSPRIIFIILFCNIKRDSFKESLIRHPARRNNKYVVKTEFRAPQAGKVSLFQLLFLEVKRGPSQIYDSLHCCCFLYISLHIHPEGKCWDWSVWICWFLVSSVQGRMEQSLQASLGWNSSCVANNLNTAAIVLLSLLLIYHFISSKLHSAADTSVLWICQLSQNSSWKWSFGITSLSYILWVNVVACFSLSFCTFVRCQ